MPRSIPSLDSDNRHAPGARIIRTRIIVALVQIVSATAMPQTGDAFPAALVVVLLAAGAAAGGARAKVRKE